MSEKIDNENNNGVIIGTNKGIINNYGLSYSDVKKICTDLIKNEINNYSMISHDTINQRLDEFQNELIEVIKKETSKKPTLLEAFKDPSVQNDTYEAEKSFIKRGTQELKGLLLRVLNQRIINYDSGNELLDIVLGEAVKTASILTPVQYRILSLAFVLKYTVWLNVKNKNSFRERVKNDLIPLYSRLITKDSDFQHLEFSSCAQISIGSSDLIYWFRQYEGLFAIGFDNSDYVAIVKLNNKISPLIQQCINDNSKYQFSVLSEEELKEYCDKTKFSDIEKDAILKLYKKSLPSDLKKEVISLVPELSDLFKLWDDTKLKNLQLTSVGIVIGAENIDPTGERYDLKIWI